MITAEALASTLGRTPGSIIARLVHLGLYPNRDVARTANMERHGATAAVAEVVNPAVTVFGTLLVELRNALQQRPPAKVGELRKLVQAPDLLQPPPGAMAALENDQELLAVVASLPHLRIALEALETALDDRATVSEHGAAVELGTRLRKMAVLMQTVTGIAHLIDVRGSGNGDQGRRVGSRRGRPRRRGRRPR